MLLNEFMTTRIEFVDANGSVYDAIEKMVDKRIRSLVVKLPGKALGYGMITARDIVFKVLAKGIDPNVIKVLEIVSKPIKCIDLNMNIEDVSALMKESNISKLFVREGGKLIGVISLLDVMTASLIKRARGNHVS